MPIPALIAGLSSIVGGLASSSASSSEASTNRQFQSYEAALNRKFNADEAQKNRLFQQSMWQQTNEYNDPSAVMSRLEQAGINPALAYSGGQLGAASMQSGSQASSGASPSGAMADFSGLQHMLDPLSLSQARLNEANAKKAEADAAKTETETSWIDRLNLSTLDLNEAQKNSLEQTIKESMQKITESKSYVDLMETQISSNKLDNIVKANTLDDSIKTIKEIARKTGFDADISEQTAKLTYGYITSQILLNTAQAAQAKSNTRLLDECVETQKEITRLTGYQADVLSYDALVTGVKNSIVLGTELESEPLLPLIKSTIKRQIQYDNLKIGNEATSEGQRWVEPDSAAAYFKGFTAYLGECIKNISPLVR
ncbi:DNA pilot protein [Peromfec virus RodF5_6]|uniref:DNA pilot protein n=1 Tax=Peromfec virus RodF5_6 TaxID=2929342 RepID=A0A976R8C4_9VIRU|nr:DNA pilot protein [Peromfec virus RodF5_6]